MARPGLPAALRRARLGPSPAIGLALSSPSLFRTLHLRFEYWLFDLPEEVGGRALRLLLVPLRYLYALVRDFIRGDLGLRAMGLVFSSLFAIVPVVAVSFSVLKAFGYHRELEPVLFEFLRPLGPKGYELTANIMTFVENAQTTLLGTAGLRVPDLHRHHDDPEGRGRPQLHLARRAPAQPCQAPQRVPGHHADRPGRRRSRRWC